jgi:hypothetical protein
MFKLRRSIALVSIGLAAPAWPAELTPMIELGVLRTDNVTQATVDPRAETMWQLAPSLTLQQDSSRFKANATYRAELFRYESLGETESFSQFDGEFQAAMVPDRFFFNLGGTRAQTIIDPESNIPLSSFVLSSNRIDLDEYHLGPSFTAPAGASAVVTGDFRRAWYRYDDTPGGGLNNYTQDRSTVSVNNYRKRDGATWAARFTGEEVDYELQPVPFEYRQAALELGFWFSDTSRLFVTGGKETPWDNPFETSLEDPFWEVGAARSSDRVTAEVAVGDRSFGSSRRGSLIFKLNRGDSDVRLNYAETPTTSSADRFRVGGLIDPTQPYNYLSRPGALERYIQKRGQFELHFDLQRVRLEAVAFDETREDRTDNLGTPLGDESQSGGSLSATWGLGAKLELVLETRLADREFASGEGDDFRVASLGANYELGRRTRLEFNLQHWEQESDQNLGFSYKANVLSANVERTFR